MAREENVLVGCKLPHGIQLRVGDHIIALKGSAVPAVHRPLRQMPRHTIIEGAALTEVPKDFWEAWKKTHGDYAPFKRGFIFCQNDLAGAKAQAKELKAEKTGFERTPQEKPAKGIEADKDVMAMSQDRPSAATPPQDFSSFPPAQGKLVESQERPKPPSVLAGAPQVQGS